MKRISSLVLISFLILFAIQTTSCAQKTFEQCYSSFEKKEYGDAEKCFKSLAKKNPKNYRARMFLAKTHAYQKKLELSIQEYKAIIDEAPDTPYAKAARSTINMLGSIKLLVDAKERSQKRTIKDIIKGAISCEKLTGEIIMTCSFPCDGKLIIKKDGTKTMTYPDGESIEESPTGQYTRKDTTRFTTKGNVALSPIEDDFRKNCKIEKDGTLYFEREKGTKEYHLKNGDVKVIMGSGQKLLFTKDGEIKHL